jgi:hypothetical protein
MGHEDLVRWRIEIENKDGSVTKPETLFDAFDFPDVREVIEFSRHQSRAADAVRTAETRVDFEEIAALKIIPIRRSEW